MPRQDYSRRGFTLVEALVVMSVMSLIGLVLSSVFFASMQVWRRCSSQSQADPPAHIAIGRITKELKDAYRVDSISTNSITFTMPKTDGSGVNLVPLQGGRQISYYLSDSSGQVGHTGTVLWRKQLNLVNGTTTYRQVASNVQQLSFSCDATANRVLNIYTVAVTVLGQEGRVQYLSSFGGQVAFRN